MNEIDKIKRREGYKLNVSNFGDFISVELMREILTCYVEYCFAEMHKYANWFYKERGLDFYCEQNFNMCHNRLSGILDFAESIGLIDWLDHGDYSRRVKEELDIFNAGILARNHYGKHGMCPPVSKSNANGQP